MAKLLKSTHPTRPYSLCFPTSLICFNTSSSQPQSSPSFSVLQILFHISDKKMGRVNNASTPKMQHFSHPHELDLWNTTFQPQQGLMITNSTTLCSACQLPSAENMYICGPCKFLLHPTCAQFPQLITHPAHKNHTLALFPVAEYPGGIFNCDACNRQGNGFSYHCGSCEFDLHVLCATKPLKVTHQSHSCPLDLTFINPYDNAEGFSCDVCHNFGSKQWLYRCGACDFDVHLDCTTTACRAPAQPPTPAGVVQLQGGQQGQLLQYHRSFPGGNVHNQVGLAQPSQLAHLTQPNFLPHHYQYMHPASMGTNPMGHQDFFGPTNTVAMGMGPVMHGPPLARPNVLMHSASTGQLGNVQPSGLMSSVIQGLVEVAAQQVGQSLVQGVVGGDGGGGDGSSILGCLFGDLSGTQN